MSKQLKIIIAVISAVVLLAIIGTIAVMAQSPTPTTTPSGTPNTQININVRVAQILGITESQLTDAIKQAKTALSTPATTTPATPATPTKPTRRSPIKQADLYAKVAEILNNPAITADTITAAYQQADKEMRDQAVNNALGKAVTNGKITQDESNQIQQWWQNRPAALDKLGIPIGPGSGPGMGQGKTGFSGKMRGLENCFKNFRNQGKNPGTNTPAPATTQ
jgi:hypothetical protein